MKDVKLSYFSGAELWMLTILSSFTLILINVLEVDALLQQTARTVLALWLVLRVTAGYTTSKGWGYYFLPFLKDGAGQDPKFVRMSILMLVMITVSAMLLLPKPTGLAFLFVFGGVVHTTLLILSPIKRFGQAGYVVLTSAFVLPVVSFVLSAGSALVNLHGYLLLLNLALISSALNFAYIFSIGDAIAKKVR